MRDSYSNFYRFDSDKTLTGFNGNRIAHGILYHHLILTAIQLHIAVGRWFDSNQRLVSL